MIRPVFPLLQGSASVRFCACSPFGSAVSEGLTGPGQSGGNAGAGVSRAANGMNIRVMTSQPPVATTGAAPGRLRSFLRRGFRMGLTGRSFVLVMLAVVPALGIQAYNEFELRKASEDTIRRRVIQITKQFGAEIGELREELKARVPGSHAL